ncbi:hypothetical protein EJ03DRAFT_138619 [Teratosphaeria nubilosa]|uniref:Secreted protein n=1 Tax=Teratosphaeria nubilosa TaxID=161662 RepID=A0A6G1L5L0_9PEZI|nr:hypothetical protein EJ03DRAFT_138619 [Teratosphaeria nubilosa]
MIVCRDIIHSLQLALLALARTRLSSSANGKITASCNPIHRDVRFLIVNDYVLCHENGGSSAEGKVVTMRFLALSCNSACTTNAWLTKRRTCRARNPCRVLIISLRQACRIGTIVDNVTADAIAHDPTDCRLLSIIHEQPWTSKGPTAIDLEGTIVC